MKNTETKSTKPYLLRAIFEWAEDNGFTPQVLVDAEVDGVVVPQGHVVDGQIVLNIGSSAVHLHTMDNVSLSFSARFSGVEQNIYLPVDSILAIFARENSQGIYFDQQNNDGTDPDREPTKLKDASSTKTEPGANKSAATNINTKRKKSHLKIIK